MTNTYSANEFLEKLNDGKLRTPVICEGFAKRIENNREAFLFSAGTSCEEWTEISVEIVETVEFVGELSCRDHSHSLVRIHFKEPPSGDSFAAAFASLLRARTPEHPPTNTHFYIQKEGRPAPFIGELLGRIIADNVWYSDPSPHDNGNVALNRACFIAEMKCKGLYPVKDEKERKRACRQWKEVC